jgi:hypothetical protein
MSNRVTITTTEFKNVRESPKSKTYGFRMYDDEGQIYDNAWDSIPKTDMEVLKKVNEECASDVLDMLDFVRDNETGIYVDGNWYEWDEIKDILA